MALVIVSKLLEIAQKTPLVSSSWQPQSVNTRYFFHVLFPAIAIEEIPQLFHIWNNPKLDNSMYKKKFLRDWPLFHLQHYLDYPFDSTLVFERSLKKMFNP